MKGEGNLKHAITGARRSSQPLRSGNLCPYPRHMRVTPPLDAGVFATTDVEEHSITGADMNDDSIQDAQANIAKLQSALDDAQQMLQAAQRAQEAAQRAHDAAEAHAATLRTVSIIAIAVIVLAVLLGFRRRRS